MTCSVNQHSLWYRIFPLSLNSPKGNHYSVLSSYICFLCPWNFILSGIIQRILICFFFFFNIKSGRSICVVVSSSHSFLSFALRWEWLCLYVTIQIFDQNNAQFNIEIFCHPELHVLVQAIWTLCLQIKRIKVCFTSHISPRLCDLYSSQRESTVPVPRLLAA